MANEIPISKVTELKQKGLNQDQIIDNLLNQKYSYQQIRDAITQADIKKTVTNPSENLNKEKEAIVEKPVIPNAPVIKPQSSPSAVAPLNVIPKPTSRTTNIDIDNIQRIMEEIINEKWKGSEKILSSLIEWKGAVSSKIKDVDNRFSEFNTRITALNTIIGKKNEEFNSTMQSVDTEMQALERALNKLIPTLSDSISELKDIVSKK